MLPQLLFLAAAILVFGYAYHWAKTEIARVERQIDRLQRMLNRVGGKPVATLQLDPKTGIYLPINSF